MLSRRDKLLIQPWEDRKYKDHRSKVRSALPAIDDRAPPSRPHVELKLKKMQRESERTSKIKQDNFSLLQSFQHKVGMFYDVTSLQSRLSARVSAQCSPDSDSGYSNVKCYACLRKKSTELPSYKAGRPCQDALPAIY